MTNKGEIYRCSICGNIVDVLHDGGGTLVCCGQDMVLQKEKEIEEGNEKHKPLIEVDGEWIVVRVGSTPHPMEEKHYIEWVELTTKHGVYKKFLKPGDEPIARFPIKANLPETSARAYCNLHSLWKS
ncbi:MAG: desulfoferrodoxin [archaeon]|nr:desulfoferrodoxin [archaeon]MCR4323692.1 desulfoferrodoxin [Nanoarchaeota archaeon]